MGNKPSPRSYTIDQVSWHTGTLGNPEPREQIIRRFFLLANFLQANDLTVRDLSCREIDIDDAFSIRTSDLNAEGMALMKASYDKWLRSLETRRTPYDVSLLEKALIKLRGLAN